MIFNFGLFFKKRNEPALYVNSFHVSCILFLIIVPSPFPLWDLVPNRHFPPQTLSQHLLAESLTGDKWHRVPLPRQSTRDRVASATDTYCHTAHPKWRGWQGCFLPRTVGKASVPGLSPWLVDGCLLPVSRWHLPSMPVWVCVQNSVWDLTRSTINIPILSSILFRMVRVCSKTIETCSPALSTFIPVISTSDVFKAI